MSYISLSFADLALAAVLLLINGLISIAFSLGLERRLALATVRMIVQLLIMGSVLTWLFAQKSGLWTGSAALIMLAFAGYEIMARQERALKGLWSYGVGASAMTIAAVTVALLALTTQIRPDPWHDPRYALPVLGMILGNTMTGISLGLNTLTTSATREKAAIEAQLILGATRREAMLPIMRQALRSGLMPLINAMSAMGLVAIPGMMTGQILAGADPAEAVKYQLLIMFLIGGSTGFGTVLAIFGAMYRLSDNRHRLRLDRLYQRGK